MQEIRAHFKISERRLQEDGRGGGGETGAEAQGKLEVDGWTAQEAGVTQSAEGF